MTYKRNKNVEQSKSKESDHYDGPPKGDLDAFNKLHYIINTYLNSNSVKEWIDSLRIPIDPTQNEIMSEVFERNEIYDEMKTTINDDVYGFNSIRKSTADIFQTHLKTMTVELDTIVSQFIVEDCYNTKEGENLLEFVNSNIRNN